MDWGTVATTASTSAVASALVSNLFAEHISKRAIQIENITKERAKWRDKVRELALAMHKAATANDRAVLKELRLALSLNLNPMEMEDSSILDAVDRMSKSEELDENVLNEFSDRVALLLKFDWDRAKVEAKQARTASRTTYAEFVSGRK